MTQRERTYLQYRKIKQQSEAIYNLLTRPIVYPDKSPIRVREDDVIDYCDFCAGIGSLITSPCPYCNNGVKK